MPWLIEQIRIFRTIEEVSLTGAMAHLRIAGGKPLKASRSSGERFRLAHPAFANDSHFYGASPCTGDHKIHYYAAVAHASPESVAGSECLTLEAGEYAVVRVNDVTALRDTWIWLLSSWLPASGRKERHAPEFERFASVSESGTLIGPVEIWIPLEPIASG